jgi:hypothetical protein
MLRVLKGFACITSLHPSRFKSCNFKAGKAEHSVANLASQWNLKSLEKFLLFHAAQWIDIFQFSQFLILLNLHSLSKS